MKEFDIIAPSPISHKYAIEDLDKLKHLIKEYYAMSDFQWSDKIRFSYKGKDLDLKIEGKEVFKLVEENKKKEMFAQIEKVIGLFTKEKEND